MNTSVAYRHGDVVVQRYDGDIDIASKTEVYPSADGLVLRRGTAAGNAHVAIGNAKLYEPGDVDGSRVLVCVGDVQLAHAEHGTITLPAGSYRVTAARQGSDESWAGVED